MWEFSDATREEIAALDRGGIWWPACGHRNPWDRRGASGGRALRGRHSWRRLARQANCSFWTVAAM